MADSKVALITGASSGIGAEYARKLAQRGYDLIIHGRRVEKLQSLADEIKTKYNVNVQIETAELTNREDLNRLAEIIKNTENLEMLVNNAGFGGRERFHLEELENNLDMLNVHLTATIILTHAAIPKMLRQSRGYIINVSSVAGFFAAPRSSMYCATKSFLNTFSESLYLDLKNTGVMVQTVCPGFTLSDFHKKLGYKPDDPCFKKFMTSEFVVDHALNDLDKGKVYSIPGAKYKFFVLLSKWLPRKLLHVGVLKHYSKRKAAKICAK